MNKFYFANRTGAYVHVRLAQDGSIPPRFVFIMTNHPPRTLLQPGSVQCFATGESAKHIPELDGVAKGARQLVPQNHIPGSIIQRYRDEDNDLIFAVIVLN